MAKATTATRPRSRASARPAAPAAAAAAADPGFITVRVGRLPGRIDSIALNGGRTVADALQGAGHSSNGFEIKVNGQPAQADKALVEGDTVLMVRAIRGN